MSATPDSTLANPDQRIADLERQLAECQAERDEALGERDKAQRRLAERTAERDEALAQQTATTEVLGVINSSPGNLAPVWDAMLEKATRLCKAAAGILWIYDGARFRASAQRGLPNELVAELQRNPIPTASLQNIAAGENVVRDDDLSKNRGAERVVEEGGMRTGFLVALRQGETLLGAIRIHRREARPFSEKQIALVQNFAAQAVIAMENARLITETREALE
jgi:GAF domain-containing protein